MRIRSVLLGCTAVLFLAQSAYPRQGCVEWRSVAQGQNSTVFALAEFDSGNGPDLYVAGALTGHVARLEGDSWMIVSGLNATVRDMIVFDDGSGPCLYAGGEFSSFGGGIARWDGASWSAVGSGIPSSTVYALEVFNDGSGPALYAAGDFVTAGGVSAKSIARWDGTTWSALGAGTNSAIRAMTSYDGLGGPALYVGGYFTSAGGVTANRVAKWNGTAWSAMEPAINDRVLAIAGYDDGSGPALYVGGHFTVAGGFLVSNLTKWDGSAWTPVGSGTDDSVLTLEVRDDSFGSGPKLFMSGIFDTIDGQPLTRLVTWDGSSWEEYRGGVSGAVRDLGTFRPPSVEGTSFFVGGDFSSVGVTLSQPLPVARIARWGPFTDYTGDTFCDASDGSLASCPCNNPGDPSSGCDIAPGTGGISLTICNRETNPENRATLVGHGYPVMSGSTSLVIRSTAQLVGPLPFGDGIRCIAAPVVRLSATFASGGASVHPIGHGDSAGPGLFYYQLWFRSVPVSFCNPVEAFNLSNGKTLTW